jgi:hypothetical protein
VKLTLNSNPQFIFEGTVDEIKQLLIDVDLKFSQFMSDAGVTIEDVSDDVAPPDELSSFRYRSDAILYLLYTRGYLTTESIWEILTVCGAPHLITTKDNIKKSLYGLECADKVYRSGIQWGITEIIGVRCLDVAPRVKG